MPAATKETPAVRRYSDLLQQFDMIGETTIKDLLMELDEAVASAWAKLGIKRLLKLPAASWWRGKSDWAARASTPGRRR
jgi:hypothetical protein